ncbi:hemoglobin, alpha embryonic 5 [Antennarius striatus]|uniref:hemoglobin, alpha embryonic 5 n=1 Tax=Antennarius striatus TaxID=241820 RepID=UPI0035B322AD
MSLTVQERDAVVNLWGKISKSSDAIGAEALGRMLAVYSQTRSYFKHWTDLNYGSEPVRIHSKKIMGGINQAVSKIDDLKGGLSELSLYHAFKLKVDPANFPLLSHCLIVVISMMFPKDFTPEVHLAFDKFLAAVTAALSERYR